MHAHAQLYYNRERDNLLPYTLRATSDRQFKKTSGNVPCAREGTKIASANRPGVPGHVQNPGQYTRINLHKLVDAISLCTHKDRQRIELTNTQKDYCTMKQARDLFRRRDELARELAETDAALRKARQSYYGQRQAMPRMEAFRREVGAVS